MAYVSALRCRSCSREYPVEPLNVCDFCFGPLEVVYDYDAIARVISRERIASGPFSILRYHDLLPIDMEDAVEIEAGFTPLLKCSNLGRMLGLENLYIKNDSVNPTFSFKDRVVTIAATKAREFGFDTLACASTGNLACSVAAHAARAGHEGVRLHSRQPGARQSGRRRHLQSNPHCRGRLLRRGQPPLLRSRRQLSLGLRQHQHPPLLRRRQQDPSV